MTVRELIKELEAFDDTAKVLVPSPEEPSRSGVAITHVIKLKSGAVKLSFFTDRNFEQERDFG